MYKTRKLCFLKIGPKDIPISPNLQHLCKNWKSLLLFDMFLKITSLSFLKYVYVFPKTSLEFDYSKVKKQWNPHIRYEIIGQFHSEICLFCTEFTTKLCLTSKWLTFVIWRHGCEKKRANCLFFHSFVVNTVQNRQISLWNYLTIS